MVTPAAIKDVSETAIWVAHYRAEESERPDAMFRDPLAKVLVDGRGEKIAQSFGSMGRYTNWIVLTRTINIDEFILDGIRDGVDAVLNLGAGLDTRPYRMDLPASLQWVEADFPHLVDYKNTTLAAQTPRCQLQRVSVDLSDDAARQGFLASALPNAKKVLVLTEGVVPYLTEEQVAKLAVDLCTHPRYAFWLAEYLSPQAYRYLKAQPRMRLMANAPFRFFPPDWPGFFVTRGWKPREIRYASAVGQRFRRKPPMPLIGRLIMLMMSKERIEQMNKMSGFMLMVPNNADAQ
ncbi:MAG: SAM-dependent methyltransferase [Pseudomonadota bacterium]